MTVHELGAHSNMSVSQALELCLREKLTDVMILGYKDDKLIIRSSTMSHKDALWMLKHAEIHTLRIKT